mgnify:CR=1 FL=1
MSAISITICTERNKEKVIKKLASIHSTRKFLRFKPIEFMRKIQHGNIEPSLIVIENLREYLSPPIADVTLRSDLLGLLIRYIKMLPGNTIILFSVLRMETDPLHYILYISIGGDRKIEMPVLGFNDKKTRNLAHFLGIKPYKDLIIVNI